MNRTKGFDLGMAELRRRGLGSLTYSLAQTYLYNGTIGQDDFDLFVDVWLASPHTMTPTESCKKLANKRLEEKFDGSK